MRVRLAQAVAVDISTEKIKNDTKEKRKSINIEFSIPILKQFDLSIIYLFVVIYSYLLKDNDDLFKLKYMETRLGANKDCNTMHI